MASKGHLAQLVGEHVQIIDPSDDLQSLPIATDHHHHVLPFHFEENQLTLIGGEFSRQNSIRVIERNRISTITLQSDEEAVSNDAEPMKLVLEDQSVDHKEIPMWTYLKTGNSVTVTLTIFVLFFLVHVARILSGKLSLELIPHSF